MVPTAILSPAGVVAAVGRKVVVQGVGALQTGPLRSVLEHAARNCFFNVAVPCLQMVAKTRGIMQPPAALAPLLQALIKNILGDLPAGEVEAILALRSQVPPDPLAEIVCKEDLVGEASKDEAKEIDA